MKPILRIIIATIFFGLGICVGRLTKKDHYYQVPMDTSMAGLYWMLQATNDVDREKRASEVGIAIVYGDSRSTTNK